jgi:hypothetical protein
MNQGTIATFKALLYIRKTFEQAVAETTGDDAISLADFWENYNIRHSRQQITANNMRRVWKRILPHCANSSDFEEDIVIEEITNIGRELGFD